MLPFDRISARLLFTDDRLQIFNLKGTLFSGSLTGGADISLAKNDHHYTAQVALEKVDFPSLTELYFKYKTAQGSLNGTLDFGGVGADQRALHGSGKVEVSDGNVFAIPVFGPLSELVSKMFAGVGYSIAHEATAPFHDQGWRDSHRQAQGLGEAFLHGRAWRHQLPPEQARLRYPD